MGWWVGSGGDGAGGGRCVMPTQHSHRPTTPRHHRHKAHPPIPAAVAPPPSSWSRLPAPAAAAAPAPAAASMPTRRRRSPPLLAAVTSSSSPGRGRVAAAASLHAGRFDVTWGACCVDAAAAACACGACGVCVLGGHTRGECQQEVLGPLPSSFVLSRRRVVDVLLGEARARSGEAGASKAASI